MQPLNIISIIFAALILLAISFLFIKIDQDPQIHFLIDSAPAYWITQADEFEARSKSAQADVVFFKQTFSSKQLSAVRLNIKAFKVFLVFLDGKPLFQSKNPNEWKKHYVVKIPELSSGSHELMFVVMNNNGPPALWVHSPQLQLYSNADWKSRRHNQDWLPVQLAQHRQTPDISLEFKPVPQAFLSTLPLGLVVFVSVLLILQLRDKIKINEPVLVLRWLVLGLWAILGINSLFTTRLMGFDLPDHIEYIRYVINNASIPLATEGLQMFQSPLYYLINAVLFRVFYLIFDVETSFHLLKLLPLLLGMATVDISYRCGRRIYPDNAQMQSLILIISGFMPMNLYMAQYIGNEILLATLSALVILLFLGWLKKPALMFSLKQQALMGITLGMALLAKVSAILLIIPLSIVYIAHCRFQRIEIRSMFMIWVKVALITFLVAGWYYLRNWILLGRPFIGGWEPQSGFVWWQDPGYRMILDFVSFGQALIYPIYAWMGFWDSLYSTLWLDGFLGSRFEYETKPPWNYDYVLSSAWLSLLPSLALLSGMVITIKKSIFSSKAVLNDSLLAEYFSLLALVTYLGAIGYLFITIPIYCKGKAMYALGLLPCFAILGAVGLRPLIERNVIFKIIIFSGMSWWAANAFVAYFVVP